MLRIHPPLRRCFYAPKPNQGYTGITENEGISEGYGFTKRAFCSKCLGENSEDLDFSRLFFRRADQQTVKR